MSPTVLSRIAWSRFAGICLVAAAAAALTIASFGQTPASKQPSAQVRLGLRLFRDTRFSSPQGDLQNSCASCHLLDEDPQGMRAHTDFFSRSWVPWRTADPRREGLRNAPTILDSALMPRLHFDGEFGSLEELVKGTLAGRPMGWLPGEEDQAFDRVYEIIRNDSTEGLDQAGSYRAVFKAAYGLEPAKLGKTEVIDRVAKAISDYIRTQNSTRTTPYDGFVQANRLSTEPAKGEDPKLFANRLLGDVAALEKKRMLKLPPRFGAAAIQGLKIFFRTSGSGSTGNCVACHAPPLFTDFSFHNMGVSQGEYDRVNGDGSFATLQIPAAAKARRPSTQFREVPSKRNREFADLGHWNYVDLKGSPLRRAGESDDQLLTRMIGAFKTPTLRNLAYTQPYMHTGGFTSIESALGELMRMSEMARAGQVRSGDEELARIRITDADIPSLVAFLNALNEDFKPGGKY